MFFSTPCPTGNKIVMEEFIKLHSYCRKLSSLVSCHVFFSPVSSNLFLSWSLPFSTVLQFFSSSFAHLTRYSCHTSPDLRLRYDQSFMLFRFCFLVWRKTWNFSQQSNSLCLLNEIKGCCWKFWMSSRKSGFNTVILIFWHNSAARSLMRGRNNSNT